MFDDVVISENDDQDPWTSESDDLASRLVELRIMLHSVRNRDRVGLALLALGAIATAVVWDTVAVAVSTAIVFFLFLMVYLPLRGRPRQRAVAAIDAKLGLLDPKCRQCGYALRHLPTDRCPECGRRFRRPARGQINSVVGGGSVAVARESVESDLGFVVLLVMVLAAVVVGRLFGVQAGLNAAASAPVLSVILLVATRIRRQRRVPRRTVCDACGRSTEVDRNQCVRCGAALRAEHVYVRPGQEGRHDRRLHRSWAQVAGAIVIAVQLVLSPGRYSALSQYIPQPQDAPLLWQVPLFVLGLGLLAYDARLRSTKRLQAFDESLVPRCHRCFQMLHGCPANGTCAGCGRAYRAIDLMGGR